MRGINFQTQEDALSASAAIAISKGCTGDTLYWYSVRFINGQWWMITNNEEDTLIEEVQTDAA